MAGERVTAQGYDADGGVPTAAAARAGATKAGEAVPPDPAAHDHPPRAGHEDGVDRRDVPSARRLVPGRVGPRRRDLAEPASSQMSENVAAATAALGELNVADADAEAARRAEIMKKVAEARAKPR